MVELFACFNKFSTVLSAFFNLTLLPQMLLTLITIKQYKQKGKKIQTTQEKNLSSVWCHFISLLFRNSNNTIKVITDICVRLVSLSLVYTLWDLSLSLSHSILLPKCFYILKECQLAFAQFNIEIYTSECNNKNNNPNCIDIHEFEQTKAKTVFGDKSSRKKNNSLNERKQ